MSYDDDEPPLRRESIMEQRLRRARGDYDDEFDDTGDSPSRRAPAYGYGGGATGGGCAQATLYLVIGGIVVALLLLFAGNNLLNRVGEAFDPSGTVAELAATPTVIIVDRGATVRQIQALSRLETTQYTIETVIPVAQDQAVGGFPLPRWLAGDELLLIARGRVVAGVDLGKLREQDVTISSDGKRISVRLPPSEVLVAEVDEQGTQVYSRERGLFAPDNKDLETQGRQAARTKILETACRDGVMQQASENGQVALEKLLRLSGFEQVEVTAQAGPCVYTTTAGG
jgi:hypothetical protein